MDNPEYQALMERFRSLEYAINYYTDKTETKFSEWSENTQLRFMRELEQSGFFKVVEVVREIEKPLKTPPAQLQRVKVYYELKKGQKQILEEQIRKETKIKSAIERRIKFFCFRCKQKVSINPAETKHITKVKHNKTRFILENKCPLCLNPVKEYGGVLD